ncbi:hypothetical protein BHW_0900069 (plasmid) [Borrelia hermsii MTW]|uniref:Uncharacterized protein n=1 Tax=Borrelia hermsii MTW TaxID=1313291 RepID=W5T6M1_BORHE|nr:hypothetical protein BHW_0900069 [Borrelia hermsii MTW]
MQKSIVIDAAEKSGIEIKSGDAGAKVEMLMTLKL